jgi:hypothetical protein
VQQFLIGETGAELCGFPLERITDSRSGCILNHLLSGLKDVCAGFPDKRKGGETTYTMADIGISAFSLFFMQSESFLSY